MSHMKGFRNSSHTLSPYLHSSIGELKKYEIPGRKDWIKSINLWGTYISSKANLLGLPIPDSNI